MSELCIYNTMKLKLNNEQCLTKYFLFLISHDFFPLLSLCQKLQLCGDKLITVLATAMVAYGNVPLVSV
jgi:hypothetical protein